MWKNGAEARSGKRCERSDGSAEEEEACASAGAKAASYKRWCIARCEERADSSKLHLLADDSRGPCTVDEMR